VQRHRSWQRPGVFEDNWFPDGSQRQIDYDDVPPKRLHYHPE